MFRYERPQKGRYREFWQLGVELVNAAGIMADFQILQLVREILEGDRPIQEKYKQKLKAFLAQTNLDLCSDCQRRDKNYWLKLKQILETNNFSYQYDNHLVRGLDYYTGLVFEINLGEEKSLVGGGRYDHLAEELGGINLPAIGFAMGIDRLVNYCEKKQLLKIMLEKNFLVDYNLELKSKPNIPQIINYYQPRLLVLLREEIRVKDCQKSQEFVDKIFAFLQVIKTEKGPTAYPVIALKNLVFYLHKNNNLVEVKGELRTASEHSVLFSTSFPSTTSQDIALTFDDIGGYKSAKKGLKITIKAIKNPKKKHVTRGIVLYGPPGTGKTLLAQAFAKEIEMPFYFASGSDLKTNRLGTELGANESKLFALFEQVNDYRKKQKLKKVILFIDEFDNMSGKIFDSLEGIGGNLISGGERGFGSGGTELKELMGGGKYSKSHPEEKFTPSLKECGEVISKTLSEKKFYFVGADVEEIIKLLPNFKEDEEPIDEKVIKSCIEDFCSEKITNRKKEPNPFGGRNNFLSSGGFVSTSNF
ncbi:17649_t:CDS:2 [Gigaspora margarita]|uniref:histidine--tRNA ligase n=1 Tax=Gigaspora margarita TaxID=4874 RepID=A0ABM8VXF6_GIGMA|nr:17649_t:CDS:2 [Gigaspora margarita]